MGLSVGSNDRIIENLGSFGWQAAIIAFSATCGSIIAAWLVLTLFSRKEKAMKGSMIVLLFLWQVAYWEYWT